MIQLILSGWCKKKQADPPSFFWLQAVFEKVLIEGKSESHEGQSAR